MGTFGTQARFWKRQARQLGDDPFTLRITNDDAYEIREHHRCPDCKQLMHYVQSGFARGWYDCSHCDHMIQLITVPAVRQVRNNVA